MPAQDGKHMVLRDENYVAYVNVETRKGKVRRFAKCNPIWVSLGGDEPKVAIGAYTREFLLLRLFIWSPADNRLEYLGQGIKPVWSPNGKKLAWFKLSSYYGWSMRERWYLTVMNASDKRQMDYREIILHQVYFGNIAWSPCGDMVAISGMPWRQETADDLTLMSATKRFWKDGFSLWVINLTTGEHINVQDKGVLGTFRPNWMDSTLYYWEKTGGLLPRLVGWSSNTRNRVSDFIPTWQDEVLHYAVFDRANGFLLISGVQGSDLRKVYQLRPGQKQARFLFTLHPAAVGAMRWWPQSDNLAVMLRERERWVIALFSQSGQFIKRLLDDQDIKYLLSH